MKDKFIILLLVLIVVGLIYMMFFKPDKSALYETKLEQTEQLEEMIRNRLDSMAISINSRLDTLEALKVERTIVRNNYIGVSNEVDDISTLDSINTFIRGYLQKLGSPKFE